MSAAVTRLALCDFCHQKPKFGTHQYCGKTCATQAASLCSQCHQKPKFGNFEYCGKNCAAQAQKSSKPQPAIVPQARIQPLSVNTNVPSKQGNPARKQFKPNGAGAPLQPQPNQGALGQWVQVAAAQIPQILSNGVSKPSSGNNSGQTYTAPRPRRNPAPAAQPVHQAAVPPISPDDEYDDDEPLSAADSPQLCALPNCNQYAYIDSDGEQTGDFCSKSHRKEALDKGINTPVCIMCLSMPQSKADHFCGRACREEALSKP